MITRHGAQIARALLLCLFLTRTAFAFVDTPYLTPVDPHTGDDVHVNVRFGGCDVFVPLPGAYPAITREGNTVRILFFGYSYVDPELCYFEPYTTSPSIGQFQPGGYVVQVDWMFGGMGDYQTVHLATLPLTVAGVGAAPVPAPASSWSALFLLMLVLLTIAWRELRNRHIAGLLLILMGASSSTGRAEDAIDLQLNRPGSRGGSYS